MKNVSRAKRLLALLVSTLVLGCAIPIALLREQKAENHRLRGKLAFKDALEASVILKSPSNDRSSEWKWRT